VTAVDNDTKSIHLGVLMRIHVRKNLLVIELEFGTMKPEVLRCVHKLQETWDEIRDLVEELKFKLLEVREGDPMNKCF